jgi:prephenate dehydrogenase
METPETVAIYGVGLMGASLALALRGFGSKIIGIDPDTRIHSEALNRGIVDEIFTYSPDPTSLSQQADLIILAAPVTANLEIIKTLGDNHITPAVVMDLSSTKREICDAMGSLAPRFDPIGGHPMCGKESSSLESAEAGLFKGATFALTPIPRTTKRARQLASNLVKYIGSKEFWIDADTHDQIVAATSHLPYILASSLAGITPGEFSPLVGPGFVSTSRLAGSDIKMMHDILKTNRQNILNVINNYQRQLSAFKIALESQDDRVLENLMSTGREQRNLLLQLPPDEEII